MTYLKTVIRGVFFVGILAGVIPWFLRRTWWRSISWELGSFRYVGFFLMVFGALVSGWCAFDFAHRGEGTPAPFDPPRKLVIVGLYRFVRNPMYVGMGFLFLGEAIFFERVILMAYLAFLAIAVHLMVVFHEEPVLRKRFGSEYEDYIRRVPRWCPWGKSATR